MRIISMKQASLQKCFSKHAVGFFVAGCFFFCQEASNPPLHSPPAQIPLSAFRLLDVVRALYTPAPALLRCFHPSAATAQTSHKQSTALRHSDPFPTAASPPAGTRLSSPRTPPSLLPAGPAAAWCHCLSLATILRCHLLPPCLLPGQPGTRLCLFILRAGGGGREKPAAARSPAVTPGLSADSRAVTRPGLGLPPQASHTAERSRSPEPHACSPPSLSPPTLPAPLPTAPQRRYLGAGGPAPPAAHRGPPRRLCAAGSDAPSSPPCRPGSSPGPGSRTCFSSSSLHTWARSSRRRAGLGRAEGAGHRPLPPAEGREEPGLRKGSSQGGPRRPDARSEGREARVGPGSGQPPRRRENEARSSLPAPSPPPRRAARSIPAPPPVRARLHQQRRQRRRQRLQQQPALAMLEGSDVRAAAARLPSGRKRRRCPGGRRMGGRGTLGFCPPRRRATGGAEPGEAARKEEGTGGDGCCHLGAG